MDALTAFFLGQLSLALLLFAFIKFFIFGEPPPTPTTRPRRSSSSLLHTPRLHNKRSAILRGPAPPLTPSTILAKTYYNVAGHQPETVDWFNVLVAQTLSQLRTEALHDDALLTSLSSMLNGAAKPDFLGAISVTELALGDEFPIFSNCRVVPVDEAGNQVKSVGEGTRLLARLDVDLADAITLGVETRLLLNYPLPVVAVLPVALAVSVVRFSGTLSLSFISSHTSPNTAPQTTLAFAFLPDYRLDLSVRSLVGSRSRLQDVPKIAQLVESQIHSWLDERCVEPRYQQIVLPSIWPRRKNTRGGEDDDDSGADGEGEGEGEEDGGMETEREDGSTKQKGGAATGNTRAGASRESDGTADEPMSKQSLEAQMAAEGRKLLAAEGRSTGQEATTSGSSHGAEEAKKRVKTLRRLNSTDNLRMPGQFS